MTLTGWWRSKIPGATPIGNSSGWMESLAAVRGDLEEQNQSTEQDFLRVGEKLQTFLERIKEVSTRCTALAAVLSGDDAQDADRELRSVLRRAEALTGQAESGRQTLDHMLDGVTGIVDPLVEMHRDMRTFPVLATLIRIEGSRLDRSGVDFESLADEVRKLAIDIEQNGGAVLSAAQDLRRIVREAIPGIAEFETRQRAELPLIRSQAAESLQALNLRHARAAEASGKMAAEYDAVWEEIGGLVTSLQFHDITRQQLEHVAEALDAAGQVESGPLLARICELQCAQLKQSKSTFLAVVAQVRERLGAIAGHVSGMAAQMSLLLESSSHDECSFLGELEKGFTGIRAALCEYAESRYALAGVAETVAEGVRDMAAFVDTIEGIGIRMQRVALNANLKAIQIGEPGASLGAVAAGIQRLAADCTGQTQIVGRGIREVADRSDKFSVAMSDSSEDLAGEVQQNIATFRTSDEESRTRLAEISELGRRLAQELGSLQDGIQADALLAQAVDRSLERLARVVEQAGSLPMPESLAGHEEAMQKLEARYTMQVERAVHDSALAEEPVATPAGEWGDNVELF